MAINALRNIWAEAPHDRQERLAVFLRHQALDILQQKRSGCVLLDETKNVNNDEATGVRCTTMNASC